MADTFTEVVTRSWFSKLKGSLVGVLLGIVMLLAGFPLLWWNEGRAVRTSLSLEEGAAAVVPVQAEAVDAANEGKLVHLSGKAVAPGALMDPVLSVVADALRLRRKVEMYQWDEKKTTKTRDTLGGGSEKTISYDYEKRWLERHENSEKFRVPEGHQNPRGMPYRGGEWTAPGIAVGAFRLSAAHADKLSAFRPHPLDAGAVDGLPPELRGKAKLHGGAIFVGEDPAAPQVGDLRFRFEVVPETELSVVGRQTQGLLEPYPSKAGPAVALIEVGAHGATEMFAAAQAANAFITWLLRAAGFLLLFLGLRAIVNPVAVFADVVPLFGDIAGAGLTFISALIAATLALVTIALAWVAYRPLLAGALLAAAALCLYFFWQRKSQAHEARSRASSPFQPA